MEKPCEVEHYKGHVIQIFPDDDSDSPRDWDNLGKMVCWHRRYNLGDEQPSCSPEEWRQNLAMAIDPHLEDVIEYWENGQGWTQLKTKYPAYDGKASKIVDEMIDKAVDKILDKNVVMLPLFLYDHSGITMRTSSSTFRAMDSMGWDWGQVGFIYVTKDRIKKEMARPGKLRPDGINHELHAIKHVTKKDIARAEECLRGEVKTYDQYLTGDVYGFVIHTENSEDPDDDDGCDDHVDSCWGFYGTDDCLTEAKSVVDYEVEKAA